MAVDSKHPLHSANMPDWEKMSDTHEGERAVKDAGEKYLPATDGMRLEGMKPGERGYLAYQAYKARAHFPDIVKAAVEAMIGVMHHKPAVIQVPAIMEPMLNDLTLHGESAQMLLRRINEHQLTTGRVGLLLDVPSGQPVGNVQPYIALYNAMSILNWDDGKREELTRQQLNFVSLNESEYDRTADFEWEFVNKYRVLVLGDPLQNETSGVYQVATFQDAGTTFNPEVLQTPQIGGRSLDEIPFVFINSKDIVADPDQPPLLGLANLALTIYRGEADYRQALFMQGQDTLVVSGAEDDASFAVGAGGAIVLPQGGTAEFIGAPSEGISEMRAALENDRAVAAQKGGELLDSVSRARESGDALKIRVAARTATLNQIALAGAFGLRTILQIAARWMGANPEEVVVEPNLDFADDELTGKTLVEYLTAKSLGAPFSRRSIHRLMQERDLTTMEYEEELAEIESEEPLGGSTNEDGPVEDEEPEEAEDET